VPDLSLQAMVDRIATGDNPEVTMAELALERLGRENARLGELARLGCIPRRLDEGVVAALHGREPDHEEDGRLLDRLTQQQFAARQPDGSVIYHDGVRVPMLRLVRSDPEWRDRFRKAALGLYHHFVERTAERQRRYREVQRVGPLLERASRDRLLQVARAAERALIEPAVEAIYHAVMLGSDVGLEALSHLFESMDHAGLPTVCRALLEAFEHQLQADDPAALKRCRPWLLYYDARLRTSPESAEAAYREVLGAAEADPRLELAASSRLTTLLADTFRVGEALAIAQRGLALAEQLEDVPRAQAARWQIIKVEFRLGRSGTARDVLVEIADVARRAGEPETALVAESMAATLVAEADRRVGLERLISVNDEMRVLPAPPQSVVTIQASLAYVLQLTNVRFGLSAHTEAAAMQGPETDQVAQAVERAQFLLDSFALDAGELVLDRARELAGDRPPATLLAAGAMLDNGRGRIREALDGWTEVLGVTGPGAPSAELQIRARLNVAAMLEDRGRDTEARAWCERAVDDAGRLGNDALSGMADVIGARLALRAGDPAQAAAMLDDAQSRLGEAPRYVVDLLRVRAAVLERRGDVWRARAALEEGIAAARTLGMRDRWVEMAAQRAALAARVGDWPVAALDAAETVAGAQDLDALAHLRLTEAQDQADRAYADAMVALHALGETGDEEPLDRALRLLDGCVELEPEHPLYRLGRAYVRLHRAEWDEAASDFGSARTLLADLRATPLRRREAQCLEALAGRHLDAGEVDAALAAAARIDALAHEDEVGVRSTARSLRSAALVAAGRTDEAAAVLDEAIEVALRSGEPLLVAKLLAHGGVVAALRGDAAAGLAFWRRALRALTEAGFARSPYWWLVETVSNLWAPARALAVTELLLELRAEATTGASMRPFAPSLRGALPDEWLLKESVTLLAPDGRANVIVSSEPLDPSIDTADYADLQGRLLRAEFPGFTEHEVSETPVLGGAFGVRRLLSWTPPDADPVTQIQVYLVRGGRGYTATATASTEDFHAVELQLRQVLDALVADA
jgi:tetratricopeptide (TPR) repeat protein